MTTLNSVKSLIGKLKREEIKSLLKYLRYYQDVKDGSKGKSLQLVEAIISEPNCTSREVQTLLYGRDNYQAFNKLLNRTKDKIFEVLLFDQHLSKPYYSERNRVVFEIRKKLVQSEVLFLRGITEDLSNIQNKIISKAKDYEIYDSLIEALHAKQRFMVMQGGNKAVDLIEKQIQKFESSRAKVQNARNIWTRIGAKINQSTSPDDYIVELESAIKLLRRDFEETQSATIGYFYMFLEVEWNQIHRDYKESELILKKLFNLIIENASLYTMTRHGEVLINLANNEILLGDYKSSIENSISAQKFFDFGSVNLDVAREVEFYGCFYSKQIERAEKVVEEIYHSSRSSNTPFLFSKRAYLFACIKTLKGEIDKSNYLLRDVKEIEKDKEGWNIGTRILTIINRIEENHYESADLQVLRLEKFIKRISKFRHVRKRDIIILRILLKLINEGFDFSKVYRQRKRYFDLLESNDSEYRWRIKSPELIVFHEWYNLKMKKQIPLYRRDLSDNNFR